MTDIHEYNGRRALLIKDVFGDQWYYFVDDPHRDSQTDASGAYISSSTRCANADGLMWDSPPGVAYQWNGIPVRTNANEDIRSYVIAIYLAFGVFALPLNFLCAYFVFKKDSLSKSVKFLLLLDTFCRICEAFFYIYKGTCVMSWHCVQTTGWISGILLNRIVIALSLGMVYSMELLLHSLSINRIFAVFFKGIYYEQAQKFTLIHCLICFATPIIYHLMQVGDIVEPRTGFRCYAGAFFSPSEFYVFIWFNLNDFFDSIGHKIDYLIFAFLVLAMVLDIITILGIRLLIKSPEAKKRADLRLAIMMLITGTIWIVETSFHYFISWEFYEEFWYFFFYEAEPFLGHCVLSLVIIFFNIPQSDPKKSRVRVLSISSNSVIQRAYRTMKTTKGSI